MNQVTHEYLGKKSKFSYLRMGKRTKSPKSALVKSLNLPRGWTNEATHKCLGKRSKSSYLLEDGRTKAFISTSVKILNPSTYG